MSNRHERRRAAKIGSVRTMSYDEFSNMGSMCAWSGCMCTSSDHDKDGWSKLVLYRGRTEPNFMAIAPDKMDSDAVLCPEHAKILHAELLLDISGLSRLFNAQPAGTA